MIALTLYDGKDTPIMVRGTYREAAVCTENLSSGVVVVKSAKDGM